MNPTTLISQQQRIISEMKNELPYSKNKVKDAKRINTMIDVIESFDDTLMLNYKTNAVEALIYGLIYEWLLMFDVALGKPIPLHRMIKEIDDTINYGANLKRAECVSLLKDHEIINKIKDNTILDGKNINFDVLLKNLVTQFKNQIKWKK